MLGEARMLRDFQAHERLHYIEAVAHETLRLKSVAPLLFFEPNHAVDLGGIHLPAGTASLSPHPTLWLARAGVSRRRTVSARTLADGSHGASEWA